MTVVTALPLRPPAAACRQYPHCLAQLVAGAAAWRAVPVAHRRHRCGAQREEHVVAIRADLAWLGLDTDLEERQSARFAIYETAFERLIAQGRVYRCYESQGELDLRRKVLLSRGLPPIYDRASLLLTEATTPRALPLAKHRTGVSARPRHADCVDDGIRGPSTSIHARCPTRWCAAPMEPGSTCCPA